MDELIRKQAAIDAVEEVDWYHINERGELVQGANSREDEPLYKAKDIYDALKNIKSVQPKRGYWTKSHEHIYMGNGVKEWTNWYCSECDAPNSSPTDFCPSCGADMRGEADG